MTTIVIGAGMAGIAAARALRDARQSVIVLEARERIGGRVHTDRGFAPFPVEFGAEFIHGDNAPTWLLARDYGLRLLHWRKTDESLVRMADGSLRTMRDARLNDAGFDVTRSWALPFASFPVDTADEPLSAYLSRLGFSADQLQYTRRSWGNAAGDAIERISARAAVEEMTDTSAGHGDFRILDGYDSLLNRLADGIDIRLKTVVTTIEWERQPVRVHTANGETFEADQVVITLPLGVLKSGQICFVPELPADKQEAIGALTMGYGIKLIYRFDAPVLPEGVMALYSPRNPPMWWSPSFGHDSNAVVITAFATGDWARELLSSGKPLERALATLQAELGRPDIEPVAARLVNWVDDPYALGGYSVAPPGAADARACLAQPTAGRLFWAGEATAPNPQASTVHGAYASGQRAAAEISVMQVR